MMTQLALSLAVVVAFMASAPALAGSVRVDFEGVVDSLEISEGSEALAAEIGQSVQPGTRFSGSFTFDDAALPYFSDSGYEFLAPPWSLEVTLGAYFAVAGSPGVPLPDQFEILVLQCCSGDVEASLVNVGSYLNPLSGPGAEALTQLVFQLQLAGDEPGEPLSSNQLNQVPWDLSEFPIHPVAWSFLRDTGGEAWESVAVLGTLDTLSSVPEPGIGLLASLALLALGLRRIQR